MLCVLKKRAALQFQENFTSPAHQTTEAFQPKPSDPPAPHHEFDKFFHRKVLKPNNVVPQLCNSASSDRSGRFEGSAKRCAICGDSARCVNFGGFSYSCESCKSFFRRSHTNNAYRAYRCLQNFDCTIDVETRKNCSYCRYQRCLRNGMDSRYLRSERHKAANLAKKRTAATYSSAVVPTTTSPKVPEVAEDQCVRKLDPVYPRLILQDRSRFFNTVESFEMDILYSKYAHSFHIIPYSEETLLEGCSNLRAAAVLTETLQRVFYFCFLIPEFCQLDFYDQIILLSKGASDLGLLNAVLGYDVEESKWPRRGFPLYQTTNMTKSELERVIGAEQCTRETGFMQTIQDLRPDEHVMMLLFLLILFNPGRGNLRNPVVVAKHQMHFARMLRSYLDWRYGAGQGQSLFHKFIAKATELRNVSGVIDGISNFCELHPELNRLKCCKSFLALNFSSGSVSMNSDQTLIHGFSRD